MSSLQKKTRKRGRKVLETKTGKREIRMNGLESLRKKVSQCRYNAVSVAICVSSDHNSTFCVKGGHFVNMRPHSLSESRPPFPLSSFFTESCGVELIQTCICPPLLQKDWLGQIGKRRLFFGADQHNSETITRTGSLSAHEIIYSVNL